MRTEINKGLILRGPRQLERLHGELPEHLEDHAVQVRVDHISLCGSDFALYHGRYRGPAAYPIRFGHEWSGKVEAVGAAVTRVAVGDYVTGDCSKWCGECPSCAFDRNLCQSVGKFGITEHGMSQNHVVIDERYLYSDKLGIGPEFLALAEPFAVALHSIRRAGAAGPQPPGGAAIVGGGAIGLCVYLLFRYHFGWRQLQLFEESARKRELIQRCFPEIVTSCQEVEDFSQLDTYRSLYRDGTPYVFEASGSAAGLSLATALAAPGGTVAMVGFLSEPYALLNIVTLKALRLVGSIGGTGAFEDVLSFLAAHRATVARLVTGHYSATQAEQAFIDGSRRDEHIKVQIHLSNWTEE